MKKISLGLLIVLSPVLLPAQEIMRVDGAVLTVSNSGILTVAGGVTLTDGSLLTNEGSIAVLPNDSVKGVVRWEDHTSLPYHHGPGDLSFSGAGIHAISSPNTFGRLLIDNDGTQLASDLSADSWALRRGAVKTNGFRAIATSSSQSAVFADSGNTGYSRSWIEGTLRRYVTPSTIDSYELPVGAAGQVHMVQLDHLSSMPLSGTQFIDISFRPETFSDGKLRHGGVWELRPDAAPAGGQYDLVVPGAAGAAILSRPTDEKEWQAVSTSGLKGFGQFSVGELAGRALVKISLYPNPARGMFNIRIDGDDNKYQAMVTDELGKLIRVVQLTGNNTQQVSGLQTGVYFVRIPDAGSFVQKVIVGQP